MKFSNTTGAAALIGLSVLYGAVALSTRHSAASEPPPDLSAKDKGVDVLQTVQLLISSEGKGSVVDIRTKQDFDRYHVSGAMPVPEGSAGTVLEAAKGRNPVILIASTDAMAARIAGEMLAEEPTRKVHFVKDGARAFYLATELPVPLFTDKPVPSGYEESIATVKAWLRAPDAGKSKDAETALQFLAKNKVEPTALMAAKKAASAGGGKKKISGGCGG